MGRNRAYPGPDDDVGDEHEEREPDCTYTAALLADGWTRVEAQEIAAAADAKSARAPRQTKPDTSPIPFTGANPGGRDVDYLETITEEALRLMDGEP
jgi:hypothetical protein